MTSYRLCHFHQYQGTLHFPKSEEFKEHASDEKNMFEDGRNLDVDVDGALEKAC